MASADLRDELNCSICLNLYTDPVTLGCDHNFCQVCIGDVLDTQQRSGVYSCPECRAEYQERPALQRNRKLCNIVERFLSTHPEQEETTIFCTYCIHSPVPAVKSCLHCEASLCDKHLRVHNKSVEHVITEPTASFGNRKCSLHKEILKYYCTDDAICVCMSCCVIGEHKEHKVELINVSSERKKENLRNVLEKLTRKRDETEERVKSLEEHKTGLMKKSADETERVTDLIRDIREQLEALEKRVLREISRQVEQISLQVSDLIQQLEIKKDELSGKIRLIEKIFNVTDPLTVLQEQESDRAEYIDAEEGDNKDRKRDYEHIPAIGDLDEFLVSLTLRSALDDIITNIKANTCIYVQEASDILLDINTAANDLVVSDDMKTAFSSSTDQHRPDIPERFCDSQVLSTNSFSSGRHYWEVKIGKVIDEVECWRIGMSYPSIDRKGDQSVIGNNNKSWCLCRWPDGDDDAFYSVIHNAVENRLPHVPFYQTFGIYLDYEAGRLSFYELGEPIIHLHTFTATFNEPLHAAFRMWMGWMRVISREGPEGCWEVLMASADLRDELNCSICLNLYTDPVTLGCDHNFCQVCIGDVLDTQQRSGVYSCPECRAEYQDRPALQRNRKLGNIVERFLSTHPEQEETTIFCTYCIHSPVPAVKSCLYCEASFCDKHLRVHNKSVEHVITEPTASFENRKCSLHKEILKYYCTDDAICVCVSCCLIGEHKGHKVELLNVASERKKENLRNILQKLTRKRDETEERVKSLEEHKTGLLKKSADETERVTDLIRDIREQLEALEKRVLSEISRQVEQISLQVSDLIQHLEMKKDELSRKIRLIEKLVNVTDPLTVLQEQESDRAESIDAEEGDNKDRKRDYEHFPAIGDLDKVLLSLTLRSALDDIITKIKTNTCFYVQEASDILLDLNTAANDLVVSDDLKTAFSSSTDQHRPDIPERFCDSQVLSTNSFSSGRHYWEVKIGEVGCWRIGMSYPGIDRKGDQSVIGNNYKSWCLCRLPVGGNYDDNELYSVVHNSIKKRLPLEPSYQNFGIYLDYEAGRLSFYELGEPIRHLHTFTATFTEPLHAAFLVLGGWMRVISREGPEGW
ncbi:uncharacterized protein WCC33_006078 [Rhinophrynus dorsalis]